MTIDATVLTTPDDNASAALPPNTDSDDLAIRHSRNAFPSNTEEEQKQVEDDRVLDKDFQRNSSPTEPVLNDEASVEVLVDFIPPDDNTSADFTPNTYLEDLALRHSRNASLTDTEREQMQAEEDRVIQGDFPRSFPAYTK